jgi:hypothetical protein
MCIESGAKVNSLIGTNVQQSRVRCYANRTVIAAVALVCVLTIGGTSFARSPQMGSFTGDYGTSMDDAFRGCSIVDLRTSRAKPVVTLREKYRIPPSAEPVLVKSFDRRGLPEAVKFAFANPNVRGVTMGGRYIAILSTDYKEEYRDILDHELVHAYISLAAPKPLPFWFQEASAVFFSTNKTVSFYGKSTDTPGQMVGKSSELSDVYKQKLHNFQFLTEYVGEDKFRKWYTNAVMTGDVNARPLLGLTETLMETAVTHRPFPFAAVAGSTAGVLGLACLVMLVFSRRKKKMIITIE